MKIREELPKMEPMEELPLQIMESKEDELPSLQKSDSDHLYYMNDNCMTRTNLTQECIVPFESDESGDV